MSVKSDPQLLSLVHLHHLLFCNKMGEKVESRVTGVLHFSMIPSQVWLWLFGFGFKFEFDLGFGIWFWVEFCFRFRVQFHVQVGARFDLCSISSSSSIWFMFKFMFEFVWFWVQSKERCSSILSLVLCSGLILTSSSGLSSSSSLIIVGSSVRPLCLKMPFWNGPESIWWLVGISVQIGKCQSRVTLNF